MHLSDGNSEFTAKSSARMRSTKEASPLAVDSAHWLSLSLM